MVQAIFYAWENCEHSHSHHFLCLVNQMKIPNCKPLPIFWVSVFSTIKLLGGIKWTWSLLPAIIFYNIILKSNILEPKMSQTLLGYFI